MGEIFTHQKQEKKQTPKEMLNFEKNVGYPEKHEKLGEVVIKDIKKFKESLKNMEPNTIYIFDDGKGPDVKVYGKKGTISDKIFPDKIDFGGGRNPRELDLRLDQSGNIQIGLNNQRQKLDVEKYELCFDTIENINHNNKKISYKISDSSDTIENQAKRETEYSVLKFTGGKKFDENSITNLKLKKSEMEKYKLDNLTTQEYEVAKTIRLQILNKLKSFIPDPDGPSMIPPLDGEDRDKYRESFKYSRFIDEREYYVNSLLKGKSQNIINLVKSLGDNFDTSYEKTISNFKKDYDTAKEEYNFRNKMNSIKYVDPIIEQIVRYNFSKEQSEKHPEFVGPKQPK